MTKKGSEGSKRERREGIERLCQEFKKIASMEEGKSQKGLGNINDSSYNSVHDFVIILAGWRPCPIQFTLL